MKRVWAQGSVNPSSRSSPGIPKARLSRYENGHVEPSIQTLARLARALNVSEASLLGDQRAIMEDFFNVLHERGVQISSKDRDIALAVAVADMVQALGGIESVAGPSAPAKPTPPPSLPRGSLDAAPSLS